MPPAMDKEYWAPWFSRCMLLPSTGFIPADPGVSEISPASAVIARWGRKRGAGYQFRDADGEAYLHYVQELFLRCHQRPMFEKTLPLHFARGLLEEELGNPVNWSAFALKRCFPGHKRTPFQPWGPFADVQGPFLWIHPKCKPSPALIHTRRPRHEQIPVATAQGRGRRDPTIATSSAAAGTEYFNADIKFDPHDSHEFSIPVTLTKPVQGPNSSCPVDNTAPGEAIGKSAPNLRNGGSKKPAQFNKYFDVENYQVETVRGITYNFVKGLQILQKDIEAAARVKKKTVQEAMTLDETTINKKRAAMHQAESRVLALRQKREECEAIRVRRCELHDIASSKMVSAADELEDARATGAAHYYLRSLKKIERLSTMVERNCFKDIKRYEKKVQNYEDRVRVGKTEAMARMEELKAAEAESNTVAAGRRDEIKYMDAVLSFVVPGA